MAKQFCSIGLARSYFGACISDVQVENGGHSETVAVTEETYLNISLVVRGKNCLMYPNDCLIQKLKFVPHLAPSPKF